jgi:hypothetical protein
MSSGPTRTVQVRVLVAEDHVALTSLTGMKQMPTGAFSPVPITISRSRSEGIFQPSACVQNVEVGCASQRAELVGDVGAVEARGLLG